MQIVDAPDVDPCRCTLQDEIGDPLERLVGEADRFCEVIARARGDDGEAAGAALANDGVGDSATGAVATDSDYGFETFRYRSFGESFFVAGRRGIEDVGDAGAVAEGGLDGGEPRSVAAATCGGVNDEADAGTFRAGQRLAPQNFRTS